MQLTNEEQQVLDSLLKQKNAIALIEKFFVRPFEDLPQDYRGIPNDALGEQVKAHLTARSLNQSYLHQLKTSGSKSTEVNSPVAPD